MSQQVMHHIYVTQVVNAESHFEAIAQWCTTSVELPAQKLVLDGLSQHMR